MTRERNLKCLLNSIVKRIRRYSALYKKDHPTWIAYGKWQNYIRAKARNGGQNFQPRRK